MGRARTPYARILTPDYGDGIETVKMSHSGKDLPNARRITRTLMTTEVRNTFQQLEMVPSSIFKA